LAASRTAGSAEHGFDKSAPFSNLGSALSAETLAAIGW